MKTITSVLFIFVLSGGGVSGQNTIKTRDELRKQIFAATDEIACGFRYTKPKKASLPDIKETDSENKVECRTGTDSTYMTYVSFSFNGGDMTKTVDDFTLSFHFTKTDEEWLVPVATGGGISLKVLTELENSERFANELRFRENRNLTVFADDGNSSDGSSEIFVSEKPQRYARRIFARASGENIGQVSLEEQIYFTADRKRLLKLAAAKTAKIKLGDFETALPEKASRLFRRILDLATVQ